MTLIQTTENLSPVPHWKAGDDWMTHPVPHVAGVFRGAHRDEIVLGNGLVSRTFRLAPDGATISLDNHVTGESLLRAVEPEAVLTIGGHRWAVGGLVGQVNRAFLLPDELDRLKAGSDGFRLESYSLGKPQAKIVWPGKGAALRSHEAANWPPKGAALNLYFVARSPELEGIRVGVHYEMYDGSPIYAKWITVENQRNAPVRLESFVSERLAAVEGESLVDQTSHWMTPNLSVITDYSFGGAAANENNRTAYWETDPEYKSQVNFELKTPCLLEVHPPHGPDVDIAPGETFKSFTSYVVVHDSRERERQSLQLRRAYRMLAPWVTENPIMLHLTSTDPVQVHHAIDQAAECGFEMIVISFWSGLDMEDVSPANLAKYKGFADYAHSKGLQLGGYSLLASRHIDDANDVINPKTGKTGGAIFGDSPCLGSVWAQHYFEHLKTFISATGFDLLEHDGSYPGDVCASTTHPGHRGLSDSQWKQFQVIADFYRWCRERNVFLNVPDQYFLSGSNKTGMGYREANWSLPRNEQAILGRQNLFDGTWEKTPSMGWMMVPLVEYQGGGAAATIEPLHEHIPDYVRHLQNNFGYGAQACYRGPRIYDTPETRTAVKGVVDWFKQHRAILESDVIHLRRADGKKFDGILHVNPNLAERGMLVLYNPAKTAVDEEITVPLRYTGLRDHAAVLDAKGNERAVTLAGDGTAKIRVHIPAEQMSWYVLKEAR